MIKRLNEKLREIRQKLLNLFVYATSLHITAIARKKGIICTMS